MLLSHKMGRWIHREAKEIVPDAQEMDDQCISSGLLMISGASLYEVGMVYDGTEQVIQCTYQQDKHKLNGYYLVTCTLCLEFSCF